MMVMIMIMMMLMMMMMTMIMMMTTTMMMMMMMMMTMMMITATGSMVALKERGTTTIIKILQYANFKNSKYVRSKNVFVATVSRTLPFLNLAPKLLLRSTMKQVARSNANLWRF